LNDRESINTVFLTIFVLIALLGGLTFYGYSLYDRVSELEDRVSSLTAENEDLRSKVSSLLSENADLKGHVFEMEKTIDYLNRVVNLEVNSSLLNRTDIVVPSQSQMIMNLGVNQAGYIEIRILASYNLTVAVIQKYRDQYIMIYQDRMINEGVFVYPVLPGNFTLYFINVYPFDILVYVSVSHVY